MPAEPEYRNCADCGAWRVKLPGDNVGECRRRAPSPIVMGLPGGGAVPIGGVKVKTVIQYPERKHSDGCAESIKAGGCPLL